ncbi:MAG: hypothetical protein RLZZ458_1426 [Planctomycetota bacterium]
MTEGKRLMGQIQGRRLQSRRATAVMIWVSLVLLAVSLWRARVDGQVQAGVWEPAVLVLAAFITCLSLFGWLLFWPQRSNAEESPLLFFAGMLTLIPPCVIAWLMMPSAAVLRPWLSGGVFLFGILTMLSPIPAELFRVPRDRRHWLQLVTDASLSVLDVENPQVTFDGLMPETQYRLTSTSPVPVTVRAETSAREQTASLRTPVRGRAAAVERVEGPGSDETTDPWADPFHGTGRRISRVREAGASRAAVAAVAAPLSATAGSLGSAGIAATAVSAGAVAAVSASLEQQTREPLPAPVPVSRALQEQVPVGTDLIALDRRIREEEQQAFMEDDSQAGNESVAMSEGLASEIVRMERTEDDFGGVMIEGIARAGFAVGQKRVNLQIPLSPPLPGVPEVECEPTGHEPLRVRVALRQPYGLRIEVRRSEASQPLEAEISFSAVYTPARPG